MENKLISVRLLEGIYIECWESNDTVRIYHDQYNDYLDFPIQYLDSSLVDIIRKRHPTNVKDTLYLGHSPAERNYFNSINTPVHIQIRNIEIQNIINEEDISFVYNNQDFLFPISWLNEEIRDFIYKLMP